MPIFKLAVSSKYFTGVAMPSSDKANLGPGIFRR